MAPQPQSSPSPSSSSPSQTTKRRSYWRWSKNDFYPEPSFSSLPAYKSAFSATLPRLRDRLLHRSTDSTELLSLPKTSENPMKRCLSWWDLTWLSFGCVIGSGIFTLTGQEAHLHAGPAISLSYLVSGISALLSVFCYTEFSVEIPVAGGSFSFLRIELGDLVAFLAAGNILLEAIVGAAGLGRSWSSYLASVVKDDSDYFRFRVKGLAQGFNLLDPIATFVVLFFYAIATYGTRGTSVLNWISSIFSTVVIVFVIIVGFVHSKPSNLKPFLPYGTNGVFQAAAVVYWSYTGFDMVATMAEETKNPSRDIPLGLVGSMSIITVLYFLMSMTLVMMQKYDQIDVNAPYSVVFDKIGMKWAKYLVSIVALKGMSTSLLVCALGQARYVTQIARAHMIPPWFALVHPETGTPIYATLLVAITSAIVAFFSSLEVLSSVLSISTLLIFMLMAVALLVRRYYMKDVTTKKGLLKFIASLSLVFASTIGMSAIWNLGLRGWIGYVVCGVVWFVGTLALQFLPRVRTPKVWGVPLVPWLPSLSIGINMFLIGSLGYQAFVRFFICSAVMLVYYVFVGLHATYDVAHELEIEATIGEVKQPDQETRMF